MQQFKVIFPFIDDMGSVDSTTVYETAVKAKESEALWYLNSMRRHDNLQELNSLDEIEGDQVQFIPITG